jgi:hypothetical protein
MGILVPKIWAPLMGPTPRVYNINFIESARNYFNYISVIHRDHIPK